MTAIQFKGKSAVWNHHLSVPYHSLEVIKANSLSGIDSESNLVIQGDNLIALKALLPKYQGQIKCIYIDPPYNTGNDSFKYNDNFNQSTWLSFMKNRLTVAKSLLSKTGVIFIHCDNNEQATLKILLDEIFGKEPCGKWNACQ